MNLLNVLILGKDENECLGFLQKHGLPLCHYFTATPENVQERYFYELLLIWWAEFDPDKNEFHRFITTRVVSIVDLRRATKDGDLKK